MHIAHNHLNYELESVLGCSSAVAKRRVNKSTGHRMTDFGGLYLDIAKSRFGYTGADVNAAINLIQKAGVTTATGITNYSLDLGLLGLYPDQTPFLDLVPRKTSHKGDTITHWKTITNPDQFNVAMGVAEGQRTSSITPTVNLVTRAYATLGKETSYSFEAEEAAEGFENLPSQQQVQLLSAFRIGESKIAAYGNATYPLGTANTPTAAVGTGTGTLPAATYVARVVALTYEGRQQASVAGGVATTSTRNNNDGTTTTVPGGSGIASAASSGQAITLGQTLALSVTPSTGAYGYAWYIGTSSANAVLAAITNLPSVTITAAAAGTQTAASITVDNSVNPLEYDGLATQLWGTGTAIANIACGTLTSDGMGGVSQFNNAFVTLWETYKVGIDVLVCGAGVKQAILQAVFGSIGPVYHVNTLPGQTMTAGLNVDKFLDPYTGKLITIVVDPWAPNNFAFGFATHLPYALPDVPKPFWIETRMRDYYQIDWPVTTRAKYFGVYYSGVMKVPAAFAGVIFGGINTAATYVD